MKELKDFSYKAVQRFIGESEILFILRHPCILGIIATNMGDHDHPPSFILSLEPNSLESAIEKKELENIQKCMITVEIVLGMRYIHSHNFMHRNLKPSNVLLNEKNHVKICDFGLAKEDDFGTSHSKHVGTLSFNAPELFNDDENDDDDDDKRIHYTNKIDVYSFGIVLIYIMTGSYPKFNMNKVVSGTVPPLPRTIAKWVRELIVRCLSVSPKNRPSFDEIFEILKSNNYDLFSDENDKKLTKKQKNQQKEIEARVLYIEAFEFQHKKK